MTDCADIVRQAATAAGTDLLVHGNRSADPYAPPEHLSVAEAFERYAEVDLLATLTDTGLPVRDRLADAAKLAGVRIAIDDTWSDIFSRLMAERIEPNIGNGRMTILYEYPLPEAALARRKPGAAFVAERFELFACGVELANAFGELRDAQEQRRRFEADMASTILSMRRFWRRSPICRKPAAAPWDSTGLSCSCWVLRELRMFNGRRLNMAMTDEMSEKMPAATDIRSVSELIAAGLAAEKDRQNLETVTRQYSLAITSDMANLIDPGNPDDPIGRQFLPTSLELDRRPEEDSDPIGDHVHSPVKGLVHRYRDRVLLKPLHTCPVYCRFCFRRESVGPNGAGSLTASELAAAFDYVAGRKEIFEVIVSGGDPFMLSPRRICEIAETASGIEHLGVMRWHSRVPLVAPERIGPDLIEAVRRFSGAVYVAVHANHPREFTPSGRAALARMADAGIVLISQSVLLKGVNDDAEVLDALMRAFVANRVKPYYLHQGDLAPGTGHFRTTIAEGQALMRALRGRLSGIAQPTYVVDIPGGYGKVPVGPSYYADGRIADPDGNWHFK